MKRWTKELLFDLREPGINIWILPIISVIFVAGSSLLQMVLGNNNTMTLAALEICIPAMGGYASVMIMQGLLDTDGGEILYTYPRSYLYWGILRQSRLFVVQTVHVAVVCGCLSQIMQISFLEVFGLTLFQSFAVMAVSFFGVSASRKVSIGLIALIAFVGIQITLGRELNLLNWIFVLSGRMPSQAILAGICVKSICIGIFGWSVGQMWIHPDNQNR